MIALRIAGAAVLASACLLCAFRLSALGQQPPLPPVRSPPPVSPVPGVCTRSQFVVVLDVGHTIEVPGAISARGDTEYAFNLRLAEDVQNTLTGAGFDRTIVLLTGTAPPAGLFGRAARANRLRADLFISLHHDSVPENLLETWQYDGQLHHFSDRFSGYAIFISNQNVERDSNLAFARLLGAALQAKGLNYTQHYTLPVMGHRRRVLIDAKAGVYRYNKLIVLQHTRMPAVLLEAGSIINRQEELELAGIKRRAIISAAITAAVEKFCAVQSKPKNEHVTKHRSPSMPPRRAAPRDPL